jgi:indole-3-acetate monooxygenase
MTTTATMINGFMGSALIRHAEGLIPLLREQAAMTEDHRRLTPEVEAALRDGGFFRLAMPAQAGGPDATLPEVMRVLETLARGDGSAAWCAWAACGIPAASAFIDEEGARELFSPRDACIVGSVAGVGSARAVPGGYRVTGRWPFVSGINHATHAAGTCFVFDGEVQRTSPEGEPAVIAPVWPVTDCSVIDIWDTTGLRGTGSNEMVIEDVFVPERFVADFTRAPRSGLAPLYYLHENNAANVTVAALALGIAGTALAAFRELGRTKKLAGGEPLAESPLARIALATAEERLGQARGRLYETAEMMWDEAVEGAYQHEAWFPRTSLASVTAVDAAIAVTGDLYRAAGASAVFRSRSFDRCLRDLFTLGAHKTVQHLNLVLHGGATFATNGKAGA